MKMMMKATFITLLLSFNAWGVANGIGGSTGGSNSMDWSEIFASSSRYHAHFPTIVYKGSNIGIDSLCEEGEQVITAQEVPVMVQSDSNDINSPKILEYQRISIPRWRLLSTLCADGGQCNEISTESSKLKYRIKIDALESDQSVSTFEKIYVIPTCDEWEYQRHSFDSSTFWESMASGA